MLGHKHLYRYIHNAKTTPSHFWENRMKNIKLAAITVLALAASGANAQQYQQYQQVPPGYVLVPQGQVQQGYAPQGYQQQQPQQNYGQQVQDMRGTMHSLRGAVSGAQHGAARGGVDGGLAAVDSILGFIGSQSGPSQ
jgi:hypothetical protein